YPSGDAVAHHRRERAVFRAVTEKPSRPKGIADERFSRISSTTRLWQGRNRGVRSTGSGCSQAIRALVIAMVVFHRLARGNFEDWILRRAGMDMTSIKGLGRSLRNSDCDR